MRTSYILLWRSIFYIHYHIHKIYVPVSSSEPPTAASITSGLARPPRQRPYPKPTTPPIGLLNWGRPGRAFGSPPLFWAKVRSVRIINYYFIKSSSLMFLVIWGHTTHFESYDSFWVILSHMRVIWESYESDMGHTMIVTVCAVDFKLPPIWSAFCFYPLN